ncbi:AI-2E family transporter [Pseudoflavitalea sp. G-6-1-2]|uniref:AI-2E family transporter n=1 Tax=Pseudoflavitalea sp. G-6-1-2 TaxID=2728841 RepID=UPI00146BB105|nr:AI-2E family transporter [Pseudoflavitalea sp. G-6-1-2]NML22909.1 AI-2E family transporter [Pseudoflavitalea sp. G-6-1-2]
MDNTKISAYPVWFKVPMVLLGILITGYLILLGKELLAPMIIAMLLAILVLPLTSFLERKLKFPGGAASFTALFVLIAGLFLLFYLLGSQLSNLAQDWPMFKEQLLHTYEGVRDWISATFHINLNNDSDYVHKATERLLSSSSAVLGTTVVSVSSLFIFLVFTAIYTFFLLFYRKRIVTFILAVSGAGNELLVHEILEKVQYIIRKYLSGLLLEMAIVSLSCCLAFLALGIKYAILLGLIVGIFNIIPYIGFITALLLSCLVTFSTGASVATVGGVAAVIIIVHLIDSNFLFPVVVGSKVRINALATIVGVIIGQMLWGISGMFLSLPVIAILKIIFDRIDALKPWGQLLGEGDTAKQ